MFAQGAGEPAYHLVRGSGIELICLALDLNVEPCRVLGQVARLALQLAGHAFTAR
jgi:hypothetical protein